MTALRSSEAAANQRECAGMYNWFRDMTESDNPSLPQSGREQETQPKRFPVAEMITCDACGRANPPTRPACIYCGGALATANVSPVAPNVETERTAPGDGKYLVISAERIKGLAESSVAEIAALIKVRPAEFHSAIDATGPRPLYLAETAEEANRLADRFRALGLDLIIVSEKEVDRAHPFRKIRAAQVADDALIGFSVTSSDKFAIAWNKIVLVVTGRLITMQVEIEEKRKKSQSPSDARHVASDESVFDIWTNSNDVWRISANSFDFSCLGEVKKLTAFENTNRLLGLIQARAANAEVNDSYVRIRPLLDSVWPLETQTRHSQIRHISAGRREITTVTTIDNQAQFNSYSRLLYHLGRGEL